jgi:hypothetical protein
MVTTYGSLIVILRRQWVIRIVSVIEQTPTKDACLPLPEMVWETVPYSPVLHPVPERLKANIGVPCEILDDLVLVPPIWNVNSQTIHLATSVTKSIGGRTIPRTDLPAPAGSPNDTLHLSQRLPEASAGSRRGTYGSQKA